MSALENNQLALIEKCRNGEEEAQREMLRQYDDLLHIIVNKTIKLYPRMYYHYDDLLQEARIAFFNAVSQFKDDKRACFKTFASLVIKRRIWNVVRNLLVEYNHKGFEGISLDDEEINYYEIIEQSNRLAEPDYYMKFNIAKTALQNEIAQLNCAEREILSCWLVNDSYDIAAKKLGISKKQYDGRLQRIKKKIKQAVID